MRPQSYTKRTYEASGLHQVFIWGLRSTPFINMRLQAYNKCTMYIWGLRPTPSVHMRHQAYIKCTYEASGLHKGLSLFTKLASALGYSWNLHTRKNILQLIFLHSIYICTVQHTHNENTVYMFSFRKVFSEICFFMSASIRMEPKVPV